MTRRLPQSLPFPPALQRASRRHTSQVCALKNAAMAVGPRSARPYCPPWLAMAASVRVYPWRLPPCAWMPCKWSNGKE